VRRFTFVTLLVLVLVIAIAAYFQIRAAQRPGEFPGPGSGTSFPPTLGPSIGAS
jgi:hypothetical protein